MTLDTTKLIALAAAAAAGCAASSACWGWRMLAARAVRRPWASGSIYGSLGMCFGLGAALSVELQWSCNLAGKMLAGLAAGACVGLLGPDITIRLLFALAAEWEIYQRARAALRDSRSGKPPESSPPEDVPPT